MEIKWTNPAINDLKEFVKVTKMSEPSKYVIELVKQVDLLKVHSHLGKIYLYLNGHIIRQLIHQQHLIFYYEHEDTIHIIAAVHHRQDIKNKMKYIKEYFE